MAKVELRVATYRRARAGRRPTQLVYDPYVVEDLRGWLDKRLPGGVASLAFEDGLEQPIPMPPPNHHAVAPEAVPHGDMGWADQPEIAQPLPADLLVAELADVAPIGASPPLDLPQSAPAVPRFASAKPTTPGALASLMMPLPVSPAIVRLRQPPPSAMATAARRMLAMGEPDYADAILANCPPHPSLAAARRALATPTWADALLTQAEIDPDDCWPAVSVSPPVLPMPSQVAHAITVPTHVMHTALREIDAKLGAHRHARLPTDDEPWVQPSRGLPGDGGPIPDRSP